MISALKIPDRDGKQIVKFYHKDSSFIKLKFRESFRQKEWSFFASFEDLFKNIKALQRNREPGVL